MPSDRRALPRVVDTLVILAVASVFAVGCNPRSRQTTARIQKHLKEEATKDNYKWVEPVGEVMDDVARGVEQFGTVSMSSPLLAPPTTQAFNFDLKDGPNEYYEAAKRSVQGQAAVSDLEVNELSVGVRAQADLVGLMSYLSQLQGFGQDLSAYEMKGQLRDREAYIQAHRILTAVPPDATVDQHLAARAEANRYLAEHLSGPSTTRPTYPTTSTSPFDYAEGLAPTPDLAARVFPTTQLTGFGGLLPKEGPALSNRAAMHIAAGDTATETIFGLLGTPSKYTDEFKDKQILLGASMVAVSPGWRTKKGFAADVSLMTAYDYRPARPEVIKKGYEQVLKQIKEIEDAVNKKIPAKPSTPVAPSGCPLADMLRQIISDTAAAKATQDAREAAKAKDPSWKRLVVLKSLFETVAPPRNPAACKADATFDLQFKIPCPFEIGGGDTKEPTEIGNLKVAQMESDSPFKPSSTILSPSVVSKQPFDSSEVLPAEEAPIMDQVPRADKGISPLVAAVSPMTDTEVLDLASSIRRQKELALSLALALRYAGASGDAEVFEKYASRLERDVKTRSASAAVSTYSHSGGLFGFQIGPRLRAIEDPSKSDSGNVLERQTFPVLVLLGMDRDDLGIKFGCWKGQLVACEPVLKFRQSMRWLPLNSPKWYQFPPPFGEEFEPGRASELDRLRWAAGLHWANERMRKDAMPSVERLEEAKNALEAAKAAAKAAQTKSTNLGAQVKETVAVISGLRIAEEQLQSFPSLAAQLCRIRENLREYLDYEIKGSTPPATSAADLRRYEAELKRALERIKKAIDGANLDAQTSTLEVMAYAQQRMEMLGYQALGSENVQSIPISIMFPEDKKDPEPKAKVNAVAEVMHAYHSLPSVFIITGQNLDRLKEVATAGSLGETVKVIKLSKTVASIVIQPPAGGVPNRSQPVALKVASEDDSHSVGMVVFDLPQDAKQVPPKLTIARDAQGRVTGITIEGNTDGYKVEKVLEVIREAIKQADPSLKFNMNSSGGVNYNVSTGAEAPGQTNTAAPKSP